MAALPEHPGRFQSGGSGPDDENPLAAGCGYRGNPLRVPAAAVLLAHGRVLGASDRHAETVVGVADVAADALADVLDPSLLDLLRQEGVGDRRPGGADQVLGPVPNDPGHGVGGGEAADRHHGLRGHRPGLPHVLLQGGLSGEAGGAHLDAVVVDVQIPQIGQIGHGAEGVEALRIGHVDGVAHGDRGLAGDGVARHVNQLADDPVPVLQRSAVLVGAVVGVGIQELGDEVTVGGVDVDDVEAGLDRTPGGVGLPSPNVGDVGSVEPAALHRVVDVDVRRRPADDAQRRQPGVQVGDEAAAEPQLDPGQRAVRVHRLRHQGVVADVVRVPQSGEGVGAVVGGRMHRAVLGAHDTPAALRLDAPHGGQHPRAPPAHAGAVGYLVEAVPGRHRAQSYRLEQAVVSWIAHGMSARKGWSVGSGARPGAG